MKVVIGSDHAGFMLKEQIKDYYKNKIEFNDVGTYSFDSVDYPSYGKKVGEEVMTGNYDFGIVLCGTGIGISIAANKVKGVRAALVYDENTAKLAREHNNANIIALGGRTTSIDSAERIIDAFMAAKYDPRHQKRVDLISNIESENK